MGTEAFWIPAVMAAVGTGVSVYNTNQTEKKQDNRLAQQLRDKGEKQRDADAKVNNLLDKQAKSTDTDERGSALASFMKQMATQQGNALGGLDVKGATSDAYTTAKADAALGANQYGAKIADLMARIDAPMQQRSNEAVDKLRFGDDVSTIKRFDQGDDFLHQMKLRTIKNNPYLDFIGGALSGAGSSMASSGWGSGGTGGDYGITGWS